MLVPKRPRSGTSVVSTVYGARGAPFHRKNALPAAVLGAKCASRRERRPILSLNRDKVAKPRREPAMCGRAQAKTGDFPAGLRPKPAICGRAQAKTGDLRSGSGQNRRFAAGLRPKPAIWGRAQAKTGHLRPGSGQNRRFADNARPRTAEFRPSTRQNRRPGGIAGPTYAPRSPAGPRDRLSPSY